MIYIIHGDDYSSSRNYLNSLSKKFTRFDISEGSEESIIQELEGTNLFAPDKSLFLENLFNKKNVKTLENLANFIRKSNIDVYIYEKIELSQGTISIFPKAESKIFKYPQKLFIFLDNVYPKNKNAIPYFHEALNYIESDIIFFMIIRQIRAIIALIFDAQIEEVKRLADWQKNKLLAQARRFDEDSLLRLYRKLFEIDYQNKTGQSNLPLASAIDMLLLDL